MRLSALLAVVPSLVLLEGAASADDAGPLPDPMPTAATTAAQCSEKDPQCESAKFTVSKSEKIGADFDFDTGWLPASAPIQVRLFSYLHGRTRVDMSGSLEAKWPDPVRLTPIGTNGTGLLATDDGLVAKAQIRFKVNVAGKDYSWEGDIPGAPKVDFAAISSVNFDPWAWKGGPMGPQTSGKTAELDLYKVPLTDSFIPIPGIEGGFELRGQGQFDAGYVSTLIAFDEVVSKGLIPDVDGTHAFTKVLISSAPAFDTSLFVHGELTRQMKLHFIPALYFTIVGKTFALDLVDIPVPLPATTKPWDFDPVAVHVPLPRIEAKPNPIDLGSIPLGKKTAILVSLFDTGEAKLVVDATAPDGQLALETPHLDLVAGLSDAVRGSIEPTAAGPIETKIVLASNDPLVPKLEIKVKANVVEGDAPASDPSVEQAGSCGCNTPGRAGAGASASLVFLLAALSRRGRTAARDARSTSSRPRG
ncbi:MAG: hypothetical protein ACXVEE_22875 [Polyangiales bacterium]